MGLRIGLKSTVTLPQTFCCLLATTLLTAPVVAAAEEAKSAGAESSYESLAGSVLNLRRDLLSIEESMQDLAYPDRIDIYFDMDNLPYLSLRSINIMLDDQVIAQGDLSDAQRAAFNNGGIQKLYSGPLAPGRHELKALFRGNIGQANQHSQTLPFEKKPGVDVIRITVADLLQLRRPEFVFRHDHIDKP